MRQSAKAVVLACLAVGVSVAAQPRAPEKAAQAPSNPPPAAHAPAYDPALLHPATLHEKAPDEYEVKFATTKGDFVVKVTRAWAPLGADRFYNLVSHHYYDGAAFFRVLDGFMAQFGLSAYPEVSAAWQRVPIKDDAVTQSNRRGYVSFAMGGPNTRTTQVFINYGNNARLDQSGFSPFGMVTEGMGVVDKLYSGYGEGAPEGHGPEQGMIGANGRAYLEKNFPKLDTIKTATLIGPAAK